MKTFLIAAISANGMIAQTADQTSTDWTSKQDLAFFVSKTKEAGVMIMGRKTFETIGRPLKGRLVVVMSRSNNLNLPPLVMNEGVWHTNNSPHELLAYLESRGCKQAAICGGSEIYSMFLREGLIDELFLTVEPVLFGSGVPIASGFERLNLELLSSQAINSQVVLLHYRVVR